jgi:hypothetical protein
MKSCIFAATVFGFLSAAHCGYFSDENPSRFNRIFLGGGIRVPNGLGIGYQLKLGEKFNVDAGAGFDPLEGLKGSLGAGILWRDTKRFRPLIAAGISLTNGFGPTTANFNLNGKEAVGRVKSFPGTFVYASGGFQFRLWKGLGLQYALGWTQRILGQDYEVLSSTDAKVVTGVLDGLTGQGILFAVRTFWEV